MKERSGGSAASALVLTAALLVAACDGDGPLACTTEAVAGISVQLRAAGGGAELSAEDASGMAQDGARVEVLMPFLTQLVGAWERAGIYDVTVTKPGYEPWTRAHVVVLPGACHVVPVSLTAELVPLAAPTALTPRTPADG